MEQDTRRWTIWSARNEGPTFTVVEGTDLRTALADAGLCTWWLETNEPRPILNSHMSAAIPGAFDLGDDAAFDHSSPQALAELGRCIVDYIQETADEGCTGLVLS